MKQTGPALYIWLSVLYQHLGEKSAHQSNNQIL